MIPVKLKLQGFLSYREPVEVDFTGFDLACISGANGAGKSSLLDAITWALFGQARKRDEALINLACNAAEVTFTFRYEGDLYRVQRSLPRGKGTLLEFQIMDDGRRTTDDRRLTMDDGQRTTENGPSSIVHGPTWRPLTERTVRETQARIESVLRLDYETFVNASFFLQGKADQFTQQKAGERKKILGSILGLEAWDIYKDRTAERRKVLEKEIDAVDGRISEITGELNEEPQRKTRLAELETQLAQLAAARKSQESAVQAMKQAAASLAAQRALADKLRAQVERAAGGLATLEARLAEREAERGRWADILDRAEQVESAYKAWQSARADLEGWEALAAEFRQHEKRRQPFVEAIAAERARLEQEAQALTSGQEEAADQRSQMERIDADLETAGRQAAEAAARLAERDRLKSELDATRERAAALRGENDSLKIRMDEHMERIEEIGKIDGASCPLCGQALTKEHRAATIAQLKAEGREMGDRWRTNKTGLETLARELTSLERQLTPLASAENERLARSGLLSTLTERRDNLAKSVTDWEKRGAKRLKEVTKQLESGKFAVDAHKQLTQVDKELKKLGYDAARHDEVRRAESEGRAADVEYRALEAARAALAPLEREIADLVKQVAAGRAEVDAQRREYEQAAETLARSEAQAPDMHEAERSLLEAQERENILNQDVGAARQKVTVLDDLRARKSRLEADREALAGQVALHKTLERAFGRDGVPALLIEQALPEIEGKANELLDRLSDGAMSVRFVTQAEYKDRKRDDLRETLDIQISDGAGLRDYEMFSGGEAFRVNFAIRLALSKVLAQRTGARLRTLVIDEGFGSQDIQGRQRLIEAINLVRGDFDKILIITHLEELKEAFPNRIEVEKTPAGSTVRVI